MTTARNNSQFIIPEMQLEIRNDELGIIQFLITNS